MLFHYVNAQVVHTLLDGLVVSSGGSHISMSSPRQRQLRGDGTVVVAVPAHAGSCAATARASSPCPRTRAAAPQRRTRRRRARADGQLRRGDAVVKDLLCMHLGFRRAGAAAFNNTRDLRAEELPVFSDRLAIVAQFDANGVCDSFFKPLAWWSRGQWTAVQSAEQTADARGRPQAQAKAKGHAKAKLKGPASTSAKDVLWDRVCGFENKHLQALPAAGSSA